MSIEKSNKITFYNFAKAKKGSTFMKKEIAFLGSLITVMAFIPVAVNSDCLTELFDFDIKQAVTASSIIINTQNGNYTPPKSIKFIDKSSDKEYERSTKSLIYSLVGAVVDENFSENEIKSLAIAYHTQLCNESENQTLYIDTADKSIFLQENELKNKFGNSYTTLCSYCDNVYSSIIIKDNSPANLNIPLLFGKEDNHAAISQKANPYASLTHDYSTTLTFSEDEFCEKIKAIDVNIDTTITPQQMVGDITYSLNGETESIIVGGISIGGTDIVQEFSLPYDRFSLLYSLGEYQFTVLQNDVTERLTPTMAKLMAEQGNTFDEILNYCYSDL